MERLPVELKELIFSYLDTESLNIAETVCISWSQVVVARFWFPKICKIAATDKFLKEKLEADGWTPECESDHDLNRNMFFKLQSVEWLQSLQDRHHSTSNTTHCLIESCRAEELNGSHLTSFVPHNGKVFLGHSNGRIEAWSLPDFKFLSRLQTETNEAPGHFLNICPMVLRGKTLAFIDSVQQKVIVCNADDESRIAAFQVPGAEHRPLARIYDLDMNSYMLVCLWRWSVIVWRCDAEKPEATHFDPANSQALPDFEPEPEFQNWLECHEVSVNEDFLVTHASRCKNQAPDANNPIRPITSYINVRRVIKEKNTVNISASYRVDANNVMSEFTEIQSVKLSSSPLNRLAVFQVSPSLDDFQSISLKSVLDIFDLNNKSRIFSHPSPGSIFNYFQVPVQWFHELLIVKEWKEDDVVLASWDLSNHRSQILQHVQLKSANDLVLVQPYRVVQVYNKIPLNYLENSAEDEAAGPNRQIYGVFYDYWN